MVAVTTGRPIYIELKGRANVLGLSPHRFVLVNLLKHPSEMHCEHFQFSLWWCRKEGRYVVTEGQEL